MFRASFIVLAAFMMLSVACAPAVQTQADTAPATGSQSQSQAAASPSAPAQAALPPGAVQFAIVPEGSEARYRVREQLANLNFPNDAVGVTKKITGSIVLASDGTIVREQSRLTIDLVSLKSDSDRRDNYVRRSVLQTDQFPTAVFVPTGIKGLPSPLPASGEAAFTLLGDLTVKGVTKPVTWDAKATFTEQGVNGTATTTTSWEEFGISRPRVAMVLSVADTFGLEFDFQWRRAA